MAIRAALLDRDGTINFEGEYLHRIGDVEFIPGTIEGQQLLSKAGIEIIVVTNQAGSALALTMYLVETAYGVTETRDTQATYVVPDLLSVVICIARKTGCT